MRPRAVARPAAKPREVVFGVEVYSRSGANAFMQAIGATSDLGDQAGAARAVIKHLNARGGVKGRKIRSVIAEFDPTSRSFPASYQADCAAFTEDNHVAAVTSAINVWGWETLATCLKNRRTLYVPTNLNPVVDQKVFESYAPYMYAPSMLEGDRFGALVDRVHATGFFGAAVRLGVVWVGDPATDRTVRGPIKRRLSAHGIKIAQEGRVQPIYSLADVGPATSTHEQLALRFKANGVTHVLCLPTNGRGCYLFEQASDHQRYYPRLALLQEIGALGCYDHPDQCANAMGIGWNALDLVRNPEAEPGNRRNPAFTRCFEILRAAGIEIGDGSRPWFLAICDGLFFLHTASSGAPALDASGIRKAVDDLKGTYVSPQTHSTRFGPGRFAGVGAVRVVSYEKACACPRSGAWRPVG